MIGTIVIGSGNARTSHELPRDRPTRRKVSNWLKSELFPTEAANNRAFAQGRRNRQARKAQKNGGA